MSFDGEQSRICGYKIENLNKSINDLLIESRINNLLQLYSFQLITEEQLKSDKIFIEYIKLLDTKEIKLRKKLF